MRVKHFLKLIIPHFAVLSKSKFNFFSLLIIVLVSLLLLLKDYFPHCFSKSFSHEESVFSVVINQFVDLCLGHG